MTAPAQEVATDTGAPVPVDLGGSRDTSRLQGLSGVASRSLQVGPGLGGWISGHVKRQGEAGRGGGLSVPLHPFLLPPPPLPGQETRLNRGLKTPSWDPSPRACASQPAWLTSCSHLLACPAPVGTACGPALPCSGLQGQVAFPGPPLPRAGFPAHLLQKVVPAPQPASQQGSRKSQLSVLRVIKGNKQHPETISCLCYSSVLSVQQISGFHSELQQGEDFLF